MTKVRPCKEGCGYPALKGRQFCQWHALLRSSSDEQAAAARARLARLADQDRRARVAAHEWPEGERWCAGCQSFVPKFYASGSRCRACASAAAHGKRVQGIYGISVDRYYELLHQQGGRCAICRNVPRSIRLSVDHDHRSGEVRGLLCKRCNHDLLGGGHDDVLMLYRALEYLLFPPAMHPVRASHERVLEGLTIRVQARDVQPSAVEQLPPPF